ncbi:acetamidase/formamidase family protein [Bifidobacterium aquikefiri]
MIELDDTSVIYAFDPKSKPALEVPSGTTICIQTKDCFSGQIQSYRDRLGTLDWNAINPATGPIYVKGAKAQGCLKVTIHDIVLNKQAVCCTGKNEGVYGDKLEDEYLHICPVENNSLLWDDSLKIPIKPMIGVIGVAPLGEPVNCGTPMEHGGNMDNNKIGIGTVLYLPVFVEGALFACGDMHALMGNGEIGVSGAEIGGKVTVTLTAEPDLHLTTPMYETADEFGIIYSAKSLDEAAERAVHTFIELVSQRTGKDAAELTMLFSIAGNVEVCQMVDPLRTVRFTVPKSILEALGFQL